jgi:hypothetical protein
MVLFFLFLAFICVRVYTSSVPPTATFVDEIHRLVPDAQKRNFTAEFFRDPKNLETINEGVKNDFENVHKVLFKIWRKCLDFTFVTPNPSVKNVVRESFDKVFFYIQCSADEFSVDNFIRELAAFLKTYNEYYIQQGRFARGGKTIGEMVDPMILSLKYLDPNNWDKEFFAKLQKALKNEDFKKDHPEKVNESGIKNDDTKGENKGSCGVKKDSQKGKKTQKVSNNGNENNAENEAIKGNEEGNESNGIGIIGYIFAFFIIFNVVILVVILILRYKK